MLPLPQHGLSSTPDPQTPEAPVKTKRDPAALSSEYHKAHKQLMLWAAILFIWEFVGIDLDRAKDADGYAGALVKSIKSPQAVPWALLIMVVYFAFKLRVEWRQSGATRRQVREAKQDYYSACFVALVACILYFAQAISRIQVADRLQSLGTSGASSYLMGLFTLPVFAFAISRARAILRHNLRGLTGCWEALAWLFFALVTVLAAWLSPRIVGDRLQWKVYSVGMITAIPITILFYRRSYLEWPLVSLYGIAMKARRALYRAGRFQAHDLGVPVISVGNLTTGGTGKTPLVEWIGRELAQTGKRICILTRGYGRRNAGTRVIVSDGNEILADAAQAGDEPLLLAERLKGLAAVISDADRVSAARWAVEHFHSDVLVLDDGFQHLRVARDLNIVTIDATNPWGNGKLLPAGILREPRSALTRAECIVITRADDPNSTAQLQREIAAQNKDCPVFCSRMRLSGLRPIQGERGSLGTVEEIKTSPVAAFCGVGNPESFFSLLRRSGYQLGHTQVFRDHHIYTQNDIDRFLRESVTRGAKVLLTTAKDEVKLRSLKFELPCYAADIAIEIENQEKLSAVIEAAIRNTKGYRTL